MIDLAQERLGSKVVYQTDEFFAKASRIIKTEKPIFIVNKFGNHGKWMDGWETKRKRTVGNDYLIIRLGKKGIIEKVNIDTSHSMVTNQALLRYKVVTAREKFLLKV